MITSLELLGGIISILVIILLIVLSIFIFKKRIKNAKGKIKKDMIRIKRQIR
jgi:hypothetical protein